MTLTQMEYFQAVCKYENFTKAAESLHISQPAMSSAMNGLEKECGVPLFLRDKNSLKITDEGHILLEEINLVLRQNDHLRHVVNDLSLMRKYVRVGMSTLSGNQVYPKICQEFRSNFPDIQIISVEESTARQFEMLDAGLLDVIITIKRFEDPEEQKAFDAVYGHWPMRESCQYFCVSKDNALAQKSYITMEEISEEPLVMLADHFSQTRRIKENFKKRGLEYHVMHYTNQMYTIERFIEQNIAAGFLPQEVAEENPNIAGIPYDGTEFRQIEIFWRKDQFLFTATKNLIQTVKHIYPK